MVWPSRDGQVQSGGQQAGLLMCWEGRKEIPGDEGHVSHAPFQAVAPTCYGDEGSTDLGLASGWVLSAQGLTHYPEGNTMSPYSIPRASPSLFHELSPSPFPLLYTKSILQLQCEHLLS